MTGDRHQRLVELFNAARDHSADDRAAYLDETIGDEPGLREEVEVLLADFDRSALFLEAPALGASFHLDETSLLEEASRTADDDGRALGFGRDIGERIGHYRVTKVLGEGGMGMVFLAEQASPQRSVALKVIRPGIASRKMLGRFKHEVQVLGQLQHPHIAHIYEAGTVDTGSGRLPYFAMEYVRGLSLLEFAEHRRLGTRARLDLVRMICDAVQHAHQKGVVHRDLKPGNILVTEEGRPKILDFGVARATDADIQTTTQHTDVGQLIGTVPYMSPEQATGDPDALDTRSDVYSLGVVAYELLAGRLPYPVDGTMIHEAVRIIREGTPVPLSAANRVFRGDLETIIGKAMDKEPDRRYQTAAAFAEDIDRYLNDEPIEARPPTTLYQFRKFTRRNRILVSASAAVILTLLFGVIGTSVGLARAMEARDVAEAELVKSRQVTGFLRRLLEGSDPQLSAGRDTTLLRLILDDAARDIGGELAGQPAAEALIRSTIGETYRHIGDLEQAEIHLERAVELSTAHAMNDPIVFLEARHNLASLRLDQGNPDEAMQLFEAGLEQRRSAGMYSDLIADVLGIIDVHRYRMQWDRMAEAAEYWLEESRRTLGEDHAYTIRLIGALADAKNNTGHSEQAAAFYTQALEAKRRRYGEDDVRLLSTMQGLATCYRALGKLDDAEPLYRAVYERSREIFGDEHPDTATATNSLALLYKNQGRLDDAEPLYRRVLEYNRRELGEQHKYTLITLVNLAALYDKQGRYPEAIELMRERVDICTRHFGATGQTTLMARMGLAVCLDRADMVEEAVERFERLIADVRQFQPDKRDTLGYFLLMHGRCLARLERRPESEANLREAYEVLDGTSRATVRNRAAAAEALVVLYEKWNRGGEADQWRTRAKAVASK